MLFRSADVGGSFNCPDYGVCDWARYFDELYLRIGCRAEHSETLSLDYRNQPVFHFSTVCVLGEVFYRLGYSAVSLSSRLQLFGKMDNDLDHQ